MRRAARLLLGLAFCVLAACGGKAAAPEWPTYRDADGFARFLAELSVEAEPWTEEERTEYLSYLRPAEFDHPFTVDEIRGLLEHREGADSVTIAHARADVELAFELLAYGYGGYAYFGGDEVFLSIRDGILAQLERLDGPVETETLGRLLWEGLSPVMVDRHFHVFANGWSSAEEAPPYVQSTWCVRDLYFDDPTGIDPRYVKRTIGPDGAITYCLAVVCPDGGALPPSMTIEGEERTLEWRRAAPAGVNRVGEAAVLSETTVGAERIPVLANRLLYAYPERLEEFAATAARYREEPLFILDLRGHGGGNDGWATQWLTDFSVQTVSPKSMWCIKGTNISLAAWEEAGLDPSSYGLTDSLGGWSVSIHDGTIWETDNTVFVLIDQNVASAGESFVSQLAMGRRVVLVGSNTMGDLNFGNVSAFYLAHSGISLRFGASLSFRDRLENNEGVGYFPDLWVRPDDSLDAVARLCRYYGLTERENVG